MLLSNLNELKNDMVSKNWTICSFLFRYKSVVYIVLVKRFVGKEKRVNQYALLKSYYFTLNESKIDITNWMMEIVKIALSVIPQKLKEQPIILSIDDTMVEKYGEKFENRELLFDHAKHNGFNYLKGHCFVSLMLSIPVLENNCIRYLSFPVGYRMWTKEKTKLSMAAELVRYAMTVIGSERTVCLCCDSWYPKSEILSLPDEFENLVMICNVRHDTVLYDLPPEPTHKKGRPKVHGEKITTDDFIFTQVKGTDYSVDCC